MASFAAILAMGNPVALDASADERDTRGFISITTNRPSSGCTANWMLQPPVSTPTSRSTAMPTSRMCWYSRSVRVIAGLTDLLQRPADGAARHLGANSANDVFEPQPFLSALDGLGVGAAQLDN